MASRIATFFKRLSPVHAGKRAVRRIVKKIVRAAYHDYTSDNLSTLRHWSVANNLSVNALQTAAERAKARNRSRYEERENSYYSGIVWTLVNDIIGSSPRLQMLLPNDQDLNARIERDFIRWTKATDFVRKVRTAEKARWVDGESFIVLRTNPNLPTAVKLDLWLIEADQVTNPNASLISGDDGITYDQYGNPTRYTVAVAHPGGTDLALQKYVTVNAMDMIHYFRAERPGQRRGFPAFRPAFETMAQLRDYTLSTLKAARAAADIAAVIKTPMPDLNDMDSDVINDAGDDETEITVPSPMDVLPIERGQYMVLPEGTDVNQLKAEQPTTTYAEFKHELLNEIARCVSMPYNIAAANSSGYNYASGRLDHQKYNRFLSVHRRELVDQVLDRIFSAWITRWALKNDWIDFESDSTPHTWYFDPERHVDPVKEARGQDIRLKNRMSSIPREKAAEGIDWREDLRLELEYEAERRRLRDELGLPPEPEPGQENQKTQNAADPLLEILDDAE